MIDDTDSPGGGGSRNRFVYVTAALAALNGLLFGFDTGIISGAFLYIKDTFTMSPLVQGIVVSGALAGAALGAALGGYLADRWGRKRLVLVSAIVFFVGSLVMAIAPTVEILVLGRLIDGVAIGFASIVGPLYLSEIAPPKIRGSLVSLNQLAITVGILSSYFVNYAFADAEQWRWMLGTGMVPALVLAVGMVFMPESPRWLVEHGRVSEARDVLSQTRTDEQIREELGEIKETIEQEDGSLRDLLEPWMRPALVVGVGLAVLQQVTGINTVIYYAPTILESTGFESSASILATVGIGVVNVVMTIVAVVLIDRTGRRPLLSVGLGGMTLTLVALGAAFYLPGLSGMVGWVATGSLMLYVAFFAIGLGPVFWLLISEVYPLKVRGTAMGVVTIFNWVANLVVSLTFPVMVGAITKAGTFWVYAVLSAVALAFTYVFVPETKGRSLEAIEADLRENMLGQSDVGAPEGVISGDDD
ncbi:sugar porter family MFS transporter [Haloferax mediterranei ATCC 33500]|uniref:Major facilitator transporter n=1 Tax=Haloferax mediterranei (strain ATCC 33500 / DSM 1411 / JCM 8866 / NBRC 14739 / NCIMB 2177 / R-4) TaxID=523841 RepID=I3R1Y3_HALMT|nr:sugar porter family MFS transporter [Haloferax mediterranei]AFK18243.1 metabolite transport protein [Haloferax mediterranei ATCC 33500]AHZ22356.1 major facilitator transporter [Haloferax mediterranei ATCC 33500]EMA02486.1 metabolite transport protein [Haloferax mediterranei ATCC 33500]MDX5988331.1 sugar porter family MFS transporter [Haloferax mediterranei ATCC 33500]QCQ74765.1 sugar porter family MFS transporter [Haloferax mediterranei ATCC 33500]